MSARQERNNAFGDERVRLLKLYYERLGFFPVAYSHNQQGADLVVYSDMKGRNVFEVLESTNYGFKTRSRVTRITMHEDKVARYLRDLDFYDCLSPRPFKTLVISYYTNLSQRQRDIFESHKINVWTIGYQNVPFKYGDELPRVTQDIIEYTKLMERKKEE